MGCLRGRPSFWLSCWFLPGRCGRRQEDSNYPRPAEDSNVVRDVTTPGVSALLPCRGTRLPLVATPAGRAIPAMRCIRREHTVRASYKSPRPRKPYKRSPTRSRSTAQQQSSWVKRPFVQSLPSSASSAWHPVGARGRGIQHLHEDCRDRSLEPGIRLWPSIFGLSLNEPSWRLSSPTSTLYIQYALKCIMYIR
jgi:hypothetical protein